MSQLLQITEKHDNQKSQGSGNSKRRLPDWLKVKLPSGIEFNKVKSLVNKYSLHTVCEEAMCPNIGECWGRGTATFMILGKKCTRACRYCEVDTGVPGEPDTNEPEGLAESVKTLGLKYIVITSVTRADLKDHGAKHWANCISKVKEFNPETKIEILTPEFDNQDDLIKMVVDADPYVFSHNIEATENIYPKVRPLPKNGYNIALDMLKKIKRFNPDMLTKSSVIAGMGETFEDIVKTMRELYEAEVDIFYCGQYLQPTQWHWKVHKFYTPKEFNEIKKIAKEIGFKFAECGPLVRSSYRAEQVIGHRLK